MKYNIFYDEDRRTLFFSFLNYGLRKKKKLKVADSRTLGGCWKLEHTQSQSSAHFSFSLASPLTFQHQECGPFYSWRFRCRSGCSWRAQPHLHTRCGPSFRKKPNSPLNVSPCVFCFCAPQVPVIIDKKRVFFLHAITAAILWTVLFSHLNCMLAPSSVSFHEYNHLRTDR